ncbi:hypothetical protein CNY67_06205 [Desulfovibrio sp. G11]|nr:hypothetical protein CNY67_06205 [Desulfovibrio sp. G11]
MPSRKPAKQSCQSAVQSAARGLGRPVAGAANKKTAGDFTFEAMFLKVFTVLIVVPDGATGRAAAAKAGKSQARG